MIFVRLQGHDYQYDIENIIKLFYRDKEMEFSKEAPPEGFRGIFIMSSIQETENGYRLATEIQKSDEEKEGGNNRISCDISCDEFIDKDKIINKTGADLNEFPKLLKKIICRQAYMALVQFTGKEQPWGMLTGVRPAKIVHEMLEKNFSKDQILKRLDEFYRVSEDKAKILYEVACAERNILKNTSDDMVGLYIGIPFCPTRCLYCSFTSNPVSKYKKLVRSYLDALKYEIVKVSGIIKNKSLKIESIYIGGGTPTSLDAELLEELLLHVEQYMDLSSLKEYTLEAGRPDSIDEAKLNVIKKSRVDRISINPQSMNDETLRLIGRNHTADDIRTAFALARRMGFDNINMDVIVGLPGENVEMFENTLKEIEKLGPESLTVHTLAVKRASILKENIEKYQMVSDEVASKMMDLTRTYALRMCMHPYYLYRQKNMMGNMENIGYCKAGCESIYNVQIMEERQTIIALGAGAVTKVVYPDENRIERAFNVKSVDEYIERIDEMVERKGMLLI